MVKKTAKSSLGTSLRKHASDPTTVRGPITNPPAGINNGIAKLAEAYIGEYKSGANRGKPFVHLRGVIVEPKTAVELKRVWADGGVKVLPPKEIVTEGMQTSQTIPLCDTKNARGDVTELDEHVERMLNELRLLGGEECTADVDEDTLPELLESLKDAGIHFKFSTSSSTPTKDYPEERVWENWYGSKGLEDYSPEDSDDIVDGTGDGEEPDDVEEEEPEEEDEGEEPEEEEDLDQLAEEADEDNEGEAAARLTELCEEAGVDPNKYATWAEVVPLLTEDSDEEEGEEEEDEEEESEPPTKGDAFGYKPPKTKKAVDCVVTAVQARAETVSLKSLDTGKIYKAVPWDQLEDLE